jgi:mevalonate kinase
MNSMFRDASISAVAPGKAILFGEHAINRGQPAIAAAVGLYARCSVRLAERFIFQSETRHQIATREAIAAMAREVDVNRAAQNFAAICKLAAEDYFAPQKYVLASAFGESLPEGLSIRWESEIPSSSGLGSGGAAFTSMVAAITPFLRNEPTLEQRADWAHRGDVIAHGGIASALDTQTSLLGGVICYTGEGLASPVQCATGLSFVIAHTGISAATSEVNRRVREWLAEKPDVRINYFQAIGALTRAALAPLKIGDWVELGRLFNLNQLVLSKIGVSCAEIDCLIEAALGAGAFGAKISGSGGGGIVIALVDSKRKAVVSEAMAAAGGKVFGPPIGVDGVRVDTPDSAPVGG